MSRRDRSNDPSRKRAGGEDVRSHLLVERIEDGFLFVKDEGPRIVLEATGVNFELKSEVGPAGLLEVMRDLLSDRQAQSQIPVGSRDSEPDEYLETLESWQRSWPDTKRELRERR